MSAQGTSGSWGPEARRVSCYTGSMSNVVVALIAAIGASAWIYSKLYRSTGNNNKSAITASVLAFVLIFLFLWLLMNMLFPSEG